MNSSDEERGFTGVDVVTLLSHYREVRLTTLGLCEPLEIEDYLLQSMAEASPVKWHLAHTTWFFETFLLVPFVSNYQPFNPQFGVLFNSYYEAIGPRWPRSQRGMLSRPTVAEVLEYRQRVDDEIVELLKKSENKKNSSEISARIVLGLQHEQQHQELIVTDLKHAWSLNPLHPVYRPAVKESGSPPPSAWVAFEEGLASIGHDGNGFAFDNESPRHRVFQQGFQLANRLVSNSEFIEFIADGGYERPELWLSEGWAVRQSAGWDMPLYWESSGQDWSQATLSGLRPVQPDEPVCHLSFFEADAFARWANARLPTEAEWEIACERIPLSGHFQDGGRFHPSRVPTLDDVGPLHQMFGDVWQWTASPYIGYPGYRPPNGALGEYNGKFMCNQFVLRGASCATPRSHARRTYRNFFPPDARWQFAGLRLSKDLA